MLLSAPIGPIGYYRPLSTLSALSAPICYISPIGPAPFLSHTSCPLSPLQVKISDNVLYLSAYIIVSNLLHQRASPSLLLSTMDIEHLRAEMQHLRAEMTRSATEQPDVAMDSSLAVPAGPACPTGSTGPLYAMNLGTLPMERVPWEIHVDFNNDMWWAMPHELSDSILEKWTNGAQQVSFIWDWQATRKGSYQPNGTDTSINRYIIDFDTMHQRNIDNDSTRKVKVVCVLR